MPLNGLCYPGSSRASIPLNLITLGVFTLVINTWMIMMTSGLLPGFYVPGFGVSFLVSIMVCLANWGFKELGP
ncbi:MAG TPA: phage holin family protein [Desulfosporosinus sp.]|nr:phage holin family protein [Desulfosporosinus sp.]